MMVLALCMQGAGAAEWIYTVQPGDNPWSLTERLLAGIKYWPRLQSHNHIADSTHIPPGTRLRIPVGWLRRTEATATVAAVKGGAELLRVSGTPPRTLKSGAVLRTGDIVRTGERGNVTVEFKDGSRMLVHAGSELRMADLGAFANTDLVDTRVELVRGRAESLVRPLRGEPGRFEIRTPSAVTSVRGTGFRVSAEDAVTRTEVTKGKVGVRRDEAAPSEVGVAAGFGTVAAANAQPEPPVPLLPAPDLGRLPAVVERVPVAFEVPALPGCFTQGRTLDEVVLMAREAIEGFIEVLVDKGQEIPVEQLHPTRLTLDIAVQTSARA